MKVTIDTNMLIWGVKSNAKDDQRHMIPRCKRFLQWLDERGHILVLTSHVVAEYLVGWTNEERIRQLAELSANFMILPYDADACDIAAQLRSDKKFLQSLGADLGKSQVCIKSDIVVVATAKAGNVTKIYSDDPGISTLATRCGLACSPVPELTDMESLGGIQLPLPEQRPATIAIESERPRRYAGACSFQGEIMWTVFHGWRRKAGCITLVMACAVLVVWMRSCAILDVFRFSTDHRCQCIASIPGVLTWWSWDGKDSTAQFWEVMNVNSPEGIESLANQNRHRASMGESLSGGAAPIRNMRLAVIPYWSLALPLTLLSAFLLLWKPRKRDSPPPQI